MKSIKRNMYLLVLTYLILLIPLYIMHHYYLTLTIIEHSALIAIIILLTYIAGIISHTIETK